jgi:hypothetical protein
LGARRLTHRSIRARPRPRGANTDACTHCPLVAGAQGYPELATRPIFFDGGTRESRLRPRLAVVLERAVRADEVVLDRQFEDVAEGDGLSCTLTEGRCLRDNAA